LSRYTKSDFRATSCCGQSDAYPLLRPAWQRAPGLIGFLLLGPLLLYSRACLAGPPFFTDDPVPVDLGHWEINNYVAGTFAKGAFAGVLPGVDANYGAIQNVQLHLLVPIALAQSGGMSARWGLGDLEIGAKYRFIPAEEKDWWPQIAFYPFLDFPTGNADRGLGTGATHLLLPIWVQKDFGKWSTYGGGGYWINPGPGNRNFWFAGWVVQYQLTDTLNLGAEIFHQTSFSTGEPGSVGFPLGSKDTTGFNFGGVYDLNKTYHILFSFGRGLQNASDSNLFSYYLALRVTY
jgi:hypothetical protein